MSVRTSRALRIVVVATLSVVVAFIAANAWFLITTRETALHDAEEMMARDAMIKSIQADATFKSVDLVLSSIGDYIARKGATDSASYASVMSEQDTHFLLKEKIAGLPQIDAITLINTQGALINFSRFWPIPTVNISDRDYFKALSTNPDLETYISVPVQNRGDGKWNIYVARRINDPNGVFMGLILGALSVQYFQNFYANASLGTGYSTSLDREDGQMLARYPLGSANPGATRSDVGARALAAGGVERQVAAKQETVIHAARMLPNYPVMIVVSQGVDMALAKWRSMAYLLAIMAAVNTVLIIVAASAVAVWWNRQELMMKKLNVAAELAQAANRAKSTFLATMSHEIRTPMNAVLGLTSVLLETKLDDVQRDSLKSIQGAGDNLLDLLNDILDFSKLEAGQFELQDAPFSPRALIEAVVSTTSPSAKTKGLEFRIQFDSSIPDTVRGDVGRLRQVLLNLVSNAVKFTTAGEVVLSATCIALDGAKATIEWSVADSGIGIDPEKIGNLFQEFVQADSSISRRFGGTGLGLSICKRLVERMGGTIHVKSTPGKGSTFSFRITLAVSEGIPRSETGDENQSDRLKSLLAELHRPLQVLVVDDNATNRLVARRMLGEFTMELQEAVDGLEAVACASAGGFDLILMDLQMPHMDGLQAARTIRLHAGAAGEVPIIAMTANAYADDISAARESGMNDFVSKPIRKRLLVEALNRVLAARPEDSLLVTPVAKAWPTENPAALLDLSAYARLVDEIDAETAQELFEAFTAETKQILPRLRVQAQEGDVLAVRREAHALKSTAGTFGLVEVARQAQALETSALDLPQPDLLDHLTRLQDTLLRSLAEFHAHESQDRGIQVEV